MMASEENSYAAPEEAVALNTDGAAESLAIASRGKRFLNMLVDTFCAVVLAVILEVMLVLNGRELSDLGAYVLGAFVQFLFYYVWEIACGKTPGKFLTGTRVTSLDGERPTSAQIVKRSLARLIPFEAFSFLRGDGYPIGLHDSLSGTCVVSDR